MKSELVVFDTETTGLLQPDAADLASQPHIIEFYGVRIDTDFNVINEVNVLIDPGISLPPKITEITGIREDMLIDKPMFQAYYPDLVELFLGTQAMVAHNVAFDRGMLVNELRRIECEYKFPWPSRHICTVEESMYIQQRRMSLTQLHRNLFDKSFNAHRAKDDVHALVRCFHALVEKGRIEL